MSFDWDSTLPAFLKALGVTLKVGVIATSARSCAWPVRKAGQRIRRVFRSAHRSYAYEKSVFNSPCLAG